MPVDAENAPIARGIFVLATVVSGARQFPGFSGSLAIEIDGTRRGGRRDRGGDIGDDGVRIGSDELCGNEVAQVRCGDSAE